MKKTVISIFVFFLIVGSLTFAYRLGYKKESQKQEQPAQCLTILTENGAVTVPQDELSERWKESDEESAIAVSQDVLIKQRVESDGKGTFKLIGTWSQSGDKVVKVYSDSVSQDEPIKWRVESDGKGTFKLIETWSQSGDKVVKEYCHFFKWDGHELIEVYSDSKGNIKENHYQPTLFPKPAL